MSMPRRLLVRRLLLAAAVAAALWLGWVSLQVNVARSCLVDSWPEFDVCAQLLPTDPVRAVPVLRERIARNPGDSGAYLSLALLAAKPGTLGGLDEPAVIKAARELSGTQPRLLYLVADKAIQQQDWPQVVNLMVNLVEDRRDGRAAQTLARLMGAGVADVPLRAHLTASSTWLAPALAQVPAARVPMVTAMPLVVQALPLGLITPDMGLDVIKALKAEGAWYDAYALWAKMLNRPVAPVFNGEFEEGFIRDAFDWEVRESPPSRAGVAVDQPEVEGRGRVLQLEFNGRTIDMPMIRQVTLLSGRYTFSGQYMTRKLRSRDGLAWTFTCVATNKEFARSAGLIETDGQWKPFTAQVDVPPNCGPAVAVQLITFAPFESTSGLRGQASFDSLALSAAGTPR